MFSMRSALALPGLLAGALLSGCGGDEGGDDPKSKIDTARASMRDGDHKSALETFAAVFDDADADSTYQYRAKRDSLICVAKVSGEERFTDELINFTESFGEMLNADDLAKISQDLTDHEFYSLAVDVIQAAKEEYIPKLSTEEERTRVDEQLSQVAQRISETEAGAGLTDRLKSLGYLGD